MKPEQWQRIREVLEPALEIEQPLRTDWLDDHCPAELRGEVDALIAASADDDTLLDAPVFRADAPIEPGTEVGPYVIDELVGVGGMGVVYRAQDTRLQRPVAVKLLTFGGRENDMLAEARAASALNHPNIVTIHDVLEYRDAPAIVMEFVEGQTVEDRIKTGPFPRSRVARCARQIASALAAAHDAGILHRDLKPGNIIERPDGLLKVLDFGIARPARRAASGTARPAGTAGYAAPEQLAGDAMDSRADIYSFGALLRAMFGDLEATPAGWRTLIERCTDNDPDDRPASMQTVLVEIERLERRTRRPAYAALVAAALTIAIGAGFLASWMPDMPPSFNTRAIAGAEEWRRFPSLSPDGSTIAFSAPMDGGHRLFIQNVDSMSPVDLGVAGRHAAWSPSGAQLAYRSDAAGGGIFLLDVANRESRRLTSDGYFPSWSPDGRSIVYSSEGFERAEERPTTDSFLSVVEVASGSVRPLTDVGFQKDAIQPAWSPDGNRIAYWAIAADATRSVWTVAATGGAPERVTALEEFAWSPAWAPDGWLYWASDRGGTMNAWRGRIDDMGHLTTEPQAIALPANYVAYLSFAHTGAMSFSAQAPSAEIWRASLSDASLPPERLTARTRRILHPSVSPDGEHLVAFEESPRNNLVMMRSDGSDFRYLTVGNYRDRGSVWSPDGTSIAFGTNRSGQYQIWRIDPDGSNLRPAVYAPMGAHSPVWSPGAGRLAWFTRGFRPYTSTPDGNNAVPVLDPPTPGFRATSWSPDGRYLAGVLRSLDGERLGGAVLDFETKRYLRLHTGCTSVQWMPDGTRMLCVVERRFLYVDPRIDGVTEARAFPYAVDPRFDVSPDGLWLYAGVREEVPEIWLATPTPN